MLSYKQEQLNKKQFFKKHDFRKSRKLIFALLFVLLQVFAGFSQSEQKIAGLQKELSLYIANNDSTDIAKTYYSLGKIAFNSERNYESEIYLKKALKFSNKSEQRMKIYSKLGTVNWRKGKFDDAMVYYRKSLKFSEKIGDKKYQATALNNIGFIYAEYDNIDKTLEYYKNALEIRKEINYKKGVAWSYNSIGRVYNELDSLNKALIFFNKALIIFREINFYEGESNTLNNVGNVYMKKKKYKLAIKHHLEALNIRKNRNLLYLTAESYKNLTKIYIQISEYKNAEDAVKKGISISKNIKSKKLLKNFYYQLFELNKSKNNYRKALENHLIYSEYKDSLFTVESENKISELEIQYQTEKKEQKIKLLNTKNKLNSEIISGQKSKLLFLIVGSSILLIVFTIVLLIYFQRNKAYKMLVKQNIEITNLEKTQKHKISKHEISNEQQIINNLLTIIEENKYFLNTSCTIDELAKKIDTNRQYLSTIINNKFNSNFSSFINTYRVKEARRLLLDKEYNKYTIDAIANLSGFNNRATFNTAFKKITGISPSFFKKEQNLIS
ncbi:MAG: AraC family transcriptional regulator [Bacteroidales bacterium]|nr:AraC family transcriptional regulator [Bacteroidales bacterium]